MHLFCVCWMCSIATNDLPNNGNRQTKFVLSANNEISASNIKHRHSISTLPIKWVEVCFFKLVGGALINTNKKERRNKRTVEPHSTEQSHTCFPACVHVLGKLGLSLSYFQLQKILDVFWKCCEMICYQFQLWEVTGIRWKNPNRASVAVTLSAPQIHQSSSITASD